jgi:hypothetical protein
MVGCHPTSAWACRFVPENQSQDRPSGCPLILSMKALTTTMRNCACGVCHSLRLRTHRSACADLLSASAAPPPETLAVSHPHPALFSTEPECATPTTSRLSAAAALRNSASLVAETSSRCRHHNSHPSMLMWDGNDRPAMRAVKWKHARSMNPYHQPILCQVCAQLQDGIQQSRRILHRLPQWHLVHSSGMRNYHPSVKLRRPARQPTAQRY